ncbi:Asp-domain-containing protein [Thozetella sp. PMI_491]|nr:Asp-domain-containing protein [Thozetella sp. PMI_491]
MQTFGAFLVTFLAASGLVAAAPTTKIGIPVDAASGTYSAKTVRNLGFVRHGPSALAKTYNKFGKAVPANVAAAVQRNKALWAATKRATNGTGSAVASPEQYDIEYLTEVQIGTPAQTLKLDFDTGSSDLWVFSTSTASAGTGHTKFDPSKSSTAKKMTGATWSISYGDGSSSSGDVYTDVVSVGGLAVKSQAVETAKKVSQEFASFAGDGLLGLAFSTLNTIKPKAQTTFFDTALSSLDQPLFTADLKHDADGSYNFGYIDDAAFTGEITYTAVDDSQGFWTFDSKVGSNSVNAIADTGTTLMLLPDAVVEEYYSNVSGAKLDQTQGGYTFDCDAKTPDFEFTVEGATVTVPGEYMNYAPVDTTGKSCFGGLQSDADIGISIYGDVALKAAFVVFNGGEKTLGFAAKKL